MKSATTFSNKNSSRSCERGRQLVSTSVMPWWSPRNLSMRRGSECSSASRTRGLLGRPSVPTFLNESIGSRKNRKVDLVFRRSSPLLERAKSMSSAILKSIMRTAPCHMQTARPSSTKSHNSQSTLATSRASRPTWSRCRWQQVELLCNQ